MSRVLLLALPMLALGCPSDPAPTGTEVDTDTDADADSDTDADTDSDTDADTDADADTDPDVVYGTPITSGCMAGVTPRTPAAPIAPLTLSQEGELGFDATASCAGDAWTLSFEESNFSDPPTSVVIDGWDLSTGAWLGQWDGAVTGTELWGATVTGAGATCADLATTMFTGVGFDGAIPSAPTGTEDTTGAITVFSAGYDLTGGGQRVIGTIEATAADEVWMWAVYPHLDAAYGPFEVGYNGNDYVLDVDLVSNNLESSGLAFGFVACTGNAIQAVHGR